MNTLFHKGFTLIELLVVILIIGILAAVAVPQYQQAVERSRIISALPLLRSVYNAQKMYYLTNGKYATSVEQLDIDFTCPEGVMCLIGKNPDGSGVGRLPKMQLVFGHVGVILYYGSYKIENVEVEGKPYCVAASSDTRGVAICKLFGPVFATSDGATRVFLEP